MERKIGPYQDVFAASFDAQTASYEGNLDETVRASQRLEKLYEQAERCGLPVQHVDQANLQGKMYAAIEKGAQADERFFRQALESYRET